MPHVDVTPRPDASAKLPVPGNLRPEGALDDPYQYTLTTARPPGVAAVALISLILGLVLLIILAASFFGPSDTGSRVYWLALPVLLAFVVSLGLWQLYPWARIVALVFYALLTVAALASAFNNPFTWISFVAVVAPALLVIYLLGKHARKAFEHEVLN